MVEHLALCDELVGDYRGPRPCYCNLIRKVQKHQREWIVAAIMDTAFDVFMGTDGHKSISVHPEYEGLVLAAEIVKGVDPNA